MRAQTACGGQAFDLGNHQPAVVAHSNRLIQPAQISAFVFIGQIAALVRRGGAQNADVGDDVGKVQPRFAAKFHTVHYGGGGGLGVHRTALQGGVDKGLQAHLGQDPRLSRCHIAVHIEQNA